jgi:hypothetical protein
MLERGERMIRNLLTPWAKATRRLLKIWPAIAIFLVLYLTILAAVYFFVATGVATMGQVILSLVLIAAAPMLFFVIQSMSVSYAQTEAGAGKLFVGSLKSFWKLIVIAAPFVMLAVLCVYLVDKAQAPAVQTPEELAHIAKTASKHLVAAPGPPPAMVLLSALEFLILCFALPLATVHLWISAAGSGLFRAIKSAGRTIVGAFRPGPVFIYTIGLLIFGLAPYWLVAAHTHAQSPWLDIGLLGARLILAVLLSLFGWVITMGALTARVNAPQSVTPAKESGAST